MNIYNILGPLEVFREKLGIKEYLGQSLKLPDLPEIDLKWAKISQEVKQRANWHCEKCGKDLTQNKSLLELYNKSGVKADMSLDNLMAMCKSCKELLGE